MGHDSNDLTSPFLDDDISGGAPSQPAPINLTRLTAASPFERLSIQSRSADPTDEETGGAAEDVNDLQAEYTNESPYDREPEVDDETALAEECEDGTSPEEELEFDEEFKDLAPADTIDHAAAQTAFPQVIRDRIEPLPSASQVDDASKWNSARHPTKSGIDPAALRTRFDQYLNSAAIEKAMRDSAELKDLSTDARSVLVVLAHQFQQKIYAFKSQHDGKIGEGTLDALGFTRHRDDNLNQVDALNERFHVRGNSKAYQRIKEVHRKDASVFSALGSDVAPRTWYCLFVNAPFLGRLFGKGIHVELMRRLRQAEQWLLGRPLYRGMSPVELGAALRIDEDHIGGRTKNNASMHTFGLAVDIGLVKNPWVAGQEDSPNRNRKFREVTQNVSRLLSGNEEAITPAWLSRLGSDSSRTTESAYNAIQVLQTSLQVYLSLEKDPASLRTLIERARNGIRPELVVKSGETTDHAVERWTRNIRTDRGKLQYAFGSHRKPNAGFLNLHRDLVVALRDHGCLAWGAIDLGTSRSGDMMHFDCRATGIGLKLALDRQRTAGAGHPCHSTPPPSQEQEEPVSTPVASSFLGGKVWTFTAKTLPIRVAVFCPKAAISLGEVEMLVYAHGLLDPCKPVPQAPPEDFITKPPFQLGRIVDASNRAIVLVVPFLEWGSLVKKNLGFGWKNRRHALAKPANLNGVVAEALAETGRVQGIAAPSPLRLILAGHSRAYDFLDPLARAHADPQMSQGALAKLSHVWALDTTYGCPINDWMAWLASKPGLSIDAFYRKNSLTDTCDAEERRRAVKRSGGRLRIQDVPESHCGVPVKRLPVLLAAPASSPGGSPTGKEVYETEFDELDEELDGADESSEESSDEERDEVDDEAVDDEDEHEPEVDYPKTIEHEDGAVADFLTAIEEETFTPDSDDRFVVLVSGYNYAGKSDNYAQLARNLARVIAAKSDFAKDDRLVFVWFSIAAGKVYINRRQGGVWKLKNANDWTAIDEFQFAAGIKLSFAFEPIDKGRHYAGDKTFLQDEPNTVMGITDIYLFLCNLGHYRKGRLMELSVLSHGYWNGPILVNTQEQSAESSDTRNPSDKDGRGRKDFKPANLSAAALKDMQDAFHADGFSWIWGCFVTKAARAVIQGVADSKRRRTPWGRRVRGLNGAEFRPDGTTPDGAKFRFRFGRAATEEYSRGWDSAFFPTGVDYFDKTFAEIKTFAKKHSDDTYCHALAAATNKPCFGPPLGTSSNYADTDPYSPGTPVVHWVERGKKRPASEGGFEANYSATIEFFDKTMGMPEDPEGRGYVRYSGNIPAPSTHPETDESQFRDEEWEDRSGLVTGLANEDDAYSDELEEAMVEEEADDSEGHLDLEHLGILEFQLPPGSTSPTLGFEFDLNFGFEQTVADAKGLSPPAGFNWPSEGLKVTDHEWKDSLGNFKDAFVVTMDAVRMEIATVPFHIDNDVECDTVVGNVKTFGQELIDVKKTHEASLVVSGVGGHPTTFEHARTVVNKPEVDAHGNIKFPGDRDHASYDLAAVPLVIHRVSNVYPTKTGLWSSPQATVTLPLAEFGKLVWEIHRTKGGAPGEAFTGRDSDRLGLRDDLAWLALRRAMADRKKKLGTKLSDGTKVTDADFTRTITSLVTILLMYMLTSIKKDDRDERREQYAKGSLPLDVKTPLWQIHKFALTDREKFVLHELYTDPGKRENLFVLASGTTSGNGARKLFPDYTHWDAERFLGTSPTWHTLVDALVKEKPVIVTVENRLPKKGHLKGNEILIAPLSSKIDWAKTKPRIAVEMRRLGFDAVGFAKWPGLMKRVRELAKKVNP